MRSIFLPSLFTVSSIASHALAAPMQDVSSKYDFIKIDYPNSQGSTPLGINDKRQVVGYFVDKHGIDHGYLWEHGKFTKVIDYPGASGTGPGGINDKGDISGTWFDKQGFQHGFLLAPPASCASQGPVACPPVFTSIDEPNAVLNNTVPFEFGRGLGTAGLGINNSDAMVGMFCTSALYSDGFIYSAGGYQAVDNPYATHTPGNGTKFFGINDHGVVAGNYLERAPKPIYQYTHAFLLQNGSYISLDVPNSIKGGFGTQVNAVNNANVAGGVFTTPKGLYRGFLWQKGKFTTISYPGMPYTEINGMNNRGDLTGDYDTDPSGNNLYGYLAFVKGK